MGAGCVLEPDSRALKGRLRGYLRTVGGRLHGPGRSINFGLVDGPERALAVGHEARAGDVDILVIYVTTYACPLRFCPSCVAPDYSADRICNRRRRWTMSHSTLFPKMPGDDGR